MDHPLYGNLKASTGADRADKSTHDMEPVANAREARGEDEEIVKDGKTDGTRVGEAKADRIEGKAAKSDKAHE